MNHRIFIADSDNDYVEAKKIIIAYSKFLGVDLSFQDFSKELEEPNVMYAFPTGCMVLAKVSGEVVGAVGLRHFSDGVAEMKRMFVVPEFQGSGIGNSLIIEFFAQAVNLGYKSVKLDTIPELDGALSLYKKHGFLPIEAYRLNPHPNAIFMEKKIFK